MKYIFVRSTGLFKITAMLIALALAAGCERYVLVSASGEAEKPLLSLSDSTRFNGGHISVYAIDTDTGKELREEWRIESVGGTETFLDHIRYRVVPQGFREIVTSHVLEVGHLYEISGNNEGAVILTGKFYILNSKQPEVVNIDPRLRGLDLSRKIHEIEAGKKN